MSVGTIQRTPSPIVAPPAPLEPSAALPIDVSRDYADRSAPASVRAMPSTEVAAAAIPSRPPSDSSRGAAHAFAAGGVGGLDSYLEQNPDALRALITMPQGELARELRTALAAEPGYRGALGAIEAFVGAEQAIMHLSESVQSDLREMVRARAVDRIDHMRSDLQATSPAALTARLRTAPPASAEGELARAAGVRGNEMDVERVETWRDRALHQLGELRDSVMGQAWNPEDLPGSTTAVEGQLGITSWEPGSIAAEVFTRDSATDSRAHQASFAAETAMFSVESLELVAAFHAGHAVEGGMVAGPAGSIAGMVAGMVMHHVVEERRADRRDAAYALGI